VKMTYVTTALSNRFEHRYKFDAHIYNVVDKMFEDVTIFLDSGCFNTMIPVPLAKLCGQSLGFKMSYSIGGRVIEAEAFSIHELRIGNFLLKRIIAFAGEYPGEYEDDIILGANVMNNWEMLINKRTHTFQFREDPPENLPNKTHIYQNYFNKAGNYICAQIAE